MKKDINGFEKIIIALTTLFVAKKLIDNPRVAKGLFALFIIWFYIILIIGGVCWLFNLGPYAT